MARVILLVAILCYLSPGQLVSELLKLLISLLKVIVFFKQLALLKLPLAVTLIEALASSSLP